MKKHNNLLALNTALKTVTAQRLDFLLTNIES